MIGSIVDTGDLLQVIWVSIVAGIGVTAAFGFAIVGGTRALELGREGRPAATLAYGALGVVAMLVVLGAIVFGILVLVDK